MALKPHLVNQKETLAIILELLKIGVFVDEIAKESYDLLSTNESAHSKGGDRIKQRAVNSTSVSKQQNTTQPKLSPTGWAHRIHHIKQM